MSKSKRERYESERDRIQESSEISEAEAEAFIEFLDAKDPENVSVAHSDTKADGTLARYAHSLKRLGELSSFDLTEANADEMNELFDDMVTGRNPGVKDGGLTKGSVKGYQSVARKFYEYHGGIEKSDIALFTNTESPVDERDIFDKEDIQSIREAASHPRDAALVDLLLYTGQRLSAILNLRLKDIDLDDGTFYLNEEGGDLKGANGKRPLLYAEKSVRDWYNSHPCKGDRDAYFITHKYNWENKPYDAGERLDSSSVHRQLQRIGEAADVDKPMNAHNFRHSFVTICKRDYGMDNDTIKRLIGHRPDSNIMEKVYAHLTDDDVIDAAERATGLKEEEPESPLTPDVCDVCGEPVPMDTAKACPSCGIAFTPDAKQAQREVQQDIGAAKALADDELSDEELEEIANDDAILAKLIEIRSED
jgi:integrase/recombinase XerD